MRDKLAKALQLAVLYAALGVGRAAGGQETAADGLPCQARAMFVVHAGKEPWSPALTQSTFTIAEFE